VGAVADGVNMEAERLTGVNPSDCCFDDVELWFIMLGLDCCLLRCGSTAWKILEIFAVIEILLLMFVVTLLLCKCLRVFFLFWWCSKNLCRARFACFSVALLRF